MNKLPLFLSATVSACVLVVVALTAVVARQGAITSASVKQQELPRIASRPMFFEANNFEQAIVKAKNVVSRSDIRAMIVPQHLLASELMAEQIKQASNRNIQTVVIIGPNHFNVGSDIVATAQARWETGMGDVETNAKLVQKLIHDFTLTDDANVFANEHAIGVIAPFVRYYMPQAKIVPIIFNSYATQRDAERVGDWLSRNLPDDALVVYSIDFSHYLSREQADAKDRETREYVLNGDVGRIMTLGNDYLDSPASLATAMLYAKSTALNLTIEAIKNSDDFSTVKTPETTSYFLVNFTKK